MIFHRTMRINLTSALYQSTPITLLAILVTITTWNKDPLLIWGEEMALLVVAIWACWGVLREPRCLPAVGLPMAAIGLWGSIQLAVGSTVYRWATVNAALQNLALAAAWLAAYEAFRRSAARAAFLRGFLRFSLILSVIAVLSYWTSPGQILWIFPAQYPDNWGPFPSRNNFAQFLELSFPLALCELRHRDSRWTATIPSAVILGAGLASASRAGAILLLAEGICAVALLRRPRPSRPRLPLVSLAFASVGVASVAGAGVLLHRFADPNPWKFRREIFHSSVSMIEAAAGSRWLTGYGLGSFAAVYPQFAVFDSGAVVEHAHDDWLEWTAEGGLLYAALWAAIAVWTIRPAIRSVWGLGVIAVFLHALVDYPFARLGISIWVFLLLSALARENQSHQRALPREKSGAPEPLCVGGKR